MKLINVKELLYTLIIIQVFRKNISIPTTLSNLGENI
jgi:hypothetical protein